MSAIYADRAIRENFIADVKVLIGETRKRGDYEVAAAWAMKLKEAEVFLSSIDDY